MASRITRRDVDAAVTLTADAPAAVCALALEVLSRQGEARLLFAGKDFISTRAEEHGVDADTSIGKHALVRLMEQGPAEAAEYALLSALAVRGLHKHLGDTERLDRFVRHADWLTLSTAYAPYSFLDPVLEDDAQAVWARLDDESDSSDPRAVAIRALHRAVRPAGAINDTGASASDTNVRLEGRIGLWNPSGWRAVVRLVSGWALLQWFVRLLAWTVGMRRHARVHFVGGGLRVESETTMLGRTAREKQETFTLNAIASAARSSRYPHLHLLIGALMFGLGVVLGGVTLFDGIRSGETVLLLIAAVLIISGGGIDLALSSLIPGKSGVVSIDVAVLPKRRLRITHVPEDMADRFIEILTTRIAKPR